MKQESSGDSFDQYNQATGVNTEDNLPSTALGVFDECVRREAASDVEACKSMFSCGMLAGLFNDCQGGGYHPSAPRLRSGPSAEETEQVPGDEWYESDENAAEPAADENPVLDASEQQTPEESQDGEEAENSETLDETNYDGTDDGSARARGADFGSSPSWDGGSFFSPDTSDADGGWSEGEDSGQSGSDGSEEFTAPDTCHDELDNDDDDKADALDPDCSPLLNMEPHPMDPSMTNSCYNNVDDNENVRWDWKEADCRGEEGPAAQSQ